jgi:adenylate kinase family enzyme
MRRISVIGSSASGKTRTSRSLAERLGIPHLELDSIFHQPGWTQRDNAEFRTEVAEFARGDRWVVDGNYTSHGVSDIVWPRADTIVWLDPPKRTVMARVVRRTLRRVVTRQRLWNGNREPWSNLYSRDPLKNIIVWAWTRFDHTRTRYETMLTDGTWSNMTVYRLSTSHSVTQFLRDMTDSSKIADR